MNVDTPLHSNEQQQDPTIRRASDSRTDGVRHRLTPDQRREIARLYSESDTSVAELRQRFDISEVSVYRILQTQGVALRGRARTNGTAKRASTRQPRKQVARNVGRRPASPTPVVRSTSNGASQFRIEYRAERTLYAADFRDALRQAEALGAGRIEGLTREH